MYGYESLRTSTGSFGNRLTYFLPQSNIIFTLIKTINLTGKHSLLLSSFHTKQRWNDDFGERNCCFWHNLRQINVCNFLIAGQHDHHKTCYLAKPLPGYNIVCLGMRQGHQMRQCLLQKRHETMSRSLGDFWPCWRNVHGLIQYKILRSWTW